MAYPLILNKPYFVILEKQRRTLLGAVELLVPVTVFLVMSGASTASRHSAETLYFQPKSSPPRHPFIKTASAKRAITRTHL
jgi:hypothetical protein